MLRIFIQDYTSSTGAGLTGLVYNSAGLSWYYIREGDASATVVSLATATVGTFTSGGFKEIDSTNLPGMYEIGVPNAAIASGKTSHMMLKGATNMTSVLIEIETDLLNYNVASGILSVNTTQVGGTSQTARDLGASVLLSSGTGTGQLSITSGAVTVGTNNDKSGYSLTQAFPANFSAMAITGGGAVTAGTVSDKTGYSLTQTFPSNFSALGISAGGHISNVDTLTTYTGNTPQTGDGYAYLGTNLGATGSNLRLAKGTQITGLNDIAATAIVSAGAITTSGGAVITVTTATNLTNAPTSGDLTATMKASVTAAVPSAATIQSGLATSSALSTVNTNVIAVGTGVSALGSPMQAGATVVLSANGLDGITTTDPSGSSATWNFRQFLVWLFRRQGNAKVDDIANTITVIGSNGTTVLSVQPFTTTGAASTDTVGAIP